MTSAAPDVLLSAHEVSKRYGALPVLTRVDFRVGDNEAVGIVGPNGAGKTTLLNVLSGSTLPSEGRIVFGGFDLTRFDSAERCRLGLARTHQIPLPFLGMTVLENLLVAATHGGGFRRKQGYERALDSLEICGMTRVANRQVDTLGLLDRKRLELARALATDPVVLLLDEIAGGLTDAETDELVAVIGTLRDRHIAIVWIEHIVHVLLQVVERLVCMDSGQIIADGAPKEVLSNQTVIDAYLGGETA
jgi:branched-chain amino acid transport system ATP-binding protein